jgi:glucose-1-phosphate thymidylyltransferase
VDLVGVVPAAGCGARLGARLSKELLPIVVDAAAPPIPLAEHALRALAGAGLRRAVVVVGPNKPEVVRVLGDGRSAGLDLAYVVQETPSGLAAAVRAATPWLAGQGACLVLPDTVFSPPDAPRRLCRELLDRRADLVLAVFPTARPELLGPVRFDPDGRVREVFDKPAGAPPKNTWGLAAWSPRFTSFLEDALGDDWRSATTPLGRVFHAAAQAGLDVRALDLAQGAYLDVGTPEGLAALYAPRPAT